MTLTQSMRQDSIRLCPLYHAQTPDSNTVINPTHWPCEPQSPTAAYKDHTQSQEKQDYDGLQETATVDHTSSYFKSSTFWNIYSPSASIWSSTLSLLNSQSGDSRPLFSHPSSCQDCLRDTHTTSTHLFLLSIFCSVSWPMHSLWALPSWCGLHIHAQRRRKTACDWVELHLWSGARVYFWSGLFVVCMCVPANSCPNREPFSKLK